MNVERLSRKGVGHKCVLETAEALSGNLADG